MPTLDWIGKQAVLNHHREVPYHLLKCDRKLSAGDPDSGNLLVQGDNLLALKALLPYYAGQVKCIYIDPPYNIGNEKWIYNDAVNSPEIRAWLGKVVGAEAEDLSRHDKWLCMMYPRLTLLRQFLADDGAIFISIGKDELGHLRILCDEIFGPRNLIEVFVWNTEGHTENQERVTSVHEYVLAYEKKPDAAMFRDIVDPNVPEHSKIRRSFAENSITKNGPGNPASMITLPEGFPCQADDLAMPQFERFDEFEAEVETLGYITRPLTAKYSATYPLRKDDLIVRNHRVVQPCRVYAGWASAKKLRAFIEGGCKPLDDNGTQLSYYLSDRGVIYYRRENRVSRYVQTVLRGMGTTERNRYAIEAMGVHFTYPKPVELIAYLLSLVTAGDDIVMDSFIGSGTTAHATLLLNQQDGGHRRFIGIELEPQIAREALQRRLAALAQGYKVLRGQGKGRHIPGTGFAFSYSTLGEALFDEQGQIRSEVKFSDLAAHVFFTETGTPIPKRASGKTPLLGVHNDRAVCLLFNGVLGDRTVNGGNVLTGPVLNSLPPHDGPRVIYGEGCRLGKARLKREGVVFKQIPYEIKVT
ncbi:MAG: site-specific DNA-methyltransferase [Phycisphaerae bacterium]|nr:site-specific DNA-methyltransferase [Phycisphaerae bacterium]